MAAKGELEINAASDRVSCFAFHVNRFVLIFENLRNGFH